MKHHPGNYGTVIGYLREHAPAAIDQISKANGLTRSRVLLILRTAELNGDVVREPYSATEHYPWQWSATPGESEDTGQGPDLDDARAFLEDMHADTGWDYGITITASTHVAWNITIRVTPHPFEEGTSDRSLVVHRVGPPEWAVNQAIADLVGWLAEIKPPHAPGACFACGNDPDGYHGAGEAAWERQEAGQ
jgi:hypothetical protein